MAICVPIIIVLLVIDYFCGIGKYWYYFVGMFPLWALIPAALTKYLKDKIEKKLRERFAKM